MSMVHDPLNRTNTGDNTPAVINIDIVDGDHVKLSLLVKGAGCDNVSALKMFTPAQGIEAAKDFMKWWFKDEQYGKWLRIQQGYHLQHVQKYADDPFWFEDPKMSPYRNVAKYGRNIGYAGPPSRKAALAQAKYIVVDTFAKAVQSGDAKGSIEWGAKQLERIYSRG